MVETRGTPPPVGKTLRSPAAPTFSAAKLKETAAAEAGIPHWPEIVKSRVALANRAGGPYCPVKPLPRVSATRHGETAMKGRGVDAGLIAAVRATPGALTAGGGVQ